MIQLKIFAIIVLCLVPQLFALLDKSKLVHDEEYINSLNSEIFHGKLEKILVLKALLTQMCKKC